MNKRFKGHLARVGAAAAAALGSVQAFAVDPTTALEGLTTATSGIEAFGPKLWLAAVVGVGIMIGVKYIKRARGAS